MTLNPVESVTTDRSPELRDANAVWRSVLIDLEHQTTRATFDLWLRGSRALEWQPESNAWTVGVHGAEAVDWLSHRLDGVVRRTLARYAPKQPEPTVTFVVAPRSQDWLGPRPTRTGREEPEEEEDDPAGAQQVCAGPHRPPLPLGESLPPPGSGGRGEEEPPLPPGEGQGEGKPHRTRAADVRSGEAFPQSANDASDLEWTDYYIKVKLAFRREALSRLKGPLISVWFCLALHMNAEAIADPGVETIMRETGLSRGIVCRALDELCSPDLRLVEQLPRRRGRDRYRLLGYAWFGRRPARTPYEERPAGHRGTPRVP